MFSLNFVQNLVTGKISQHTESGPEVDWYGDGCSMSKAAQTDKAALGTPALKNPGAEIWLRVDFSSLRLLPYIPYVCERQGRKNAFTCHSCAMGYTGTNTSLVEFIAWGGIILLNSALCQILKLRTLPYVPHYFALMLFIF